MEVVRDRERLDLRFRVDMVENLGSYSVVYGTIGDARVRSRLTGRPQLSEEQTYDFAVRTEDLYTFDKGTGKRIRP